MKKQYRLLCAVVAFWGPLHGSDRPSADCIALAQQVRKEVREAARVELKGVELLSREKFQLVFEHYGKIKSDSEKWKILREKIPVYREALEQCTKECTNPSLDQLDIIFALSELKKIIAVQDLIEIYVEENEKLKKNGQSASPEQE